MYTKCVNGFQRSLEILETLQFIAPNFKSKVLKEVCTLPGKKGLFPDIYSNVDYFLNLFDHVAAMEAGFVIPKKGTHEEYDKISLKLKSLETEANDYLVKLRKELKIPGINFQEIKSQKEKYLIEVPTGKDVPSYFQFKSSTKKLNRYYTPEIQKIAKEIEIQQENRESVLKIVFKEFLIEFTSHSSDWIKAVKCLSILDCLFSLSKTSGYGDKFCKAEFVTTSKPFLDLREMSNPCIKVDGVSQIIPNDTVIGTNGIANSIILTGPNMGGKSSKSSVF
jgi:DNA mismatch repair protein MSH6